MVFDAEPFIAKMERTLKETGFTILTIEHDTNHKMVTRTLPVDNIVYLRGSVLFTYQEEEMFYWNGQENIRIYEGEGLNCNFTIKRLPKRYTEEELKKVVDTCYKEYGWSYNYFGTVQDTENFADEYYMDKESRRLLHCIILKKKIKNYRERYGEENQILNKQLEYYQK
jgi:hypothetical protein